MMTEWQMGRGQENVRISPVTLENKFQLFFKTFCQCWY